MSLYSSFCLSGLELSRHILVIYESTLSIKIYLQTYYTETCLYQLWICDERLSHISDKRGHGLYNSLLDTMCVSEKRNKIK